MRLTSTGTGAVGNQSDTLTRRRLLQGLGSLTAVALAGCAGDSDSPDETPTATVGETPAETPTITATATPTETRSPTPTATETPAKRDPATLEADARQFFQQLTDGEFEAGYEQLTPNAASTLTVGELEQTWNQITAGKGEFIETASATYQGTTQGYEHVVVALTFAQGQASFDVFLSENGIAGFQVTNPSYDWTVPEYVDKSAFTEQELTLDATDSCDLGATLSIPNADGPVPGVVLVHGSGPNDRDSTLGPSKPLKEIAWGLASNGIAVLRYDKRTYACQPDPTAFTIDDVVTDDALTALGRLREHDQVDAESTFLLGHSLGGELAPRIASRDGKLAGVVMLAPGGQSLAESIVRQRKHLLSLAEHLSEAQRSERLEATQKKAEKIRTLDIDDDQTIFGKGKPYYRTLQEYDHTGTAAQLDVPIFLGQGGRDYQVTVEGDLQLWRDALSGMDSVTITVYENLNHLFEPSTGAMSPEEYYRPEVPVVERVIDDIVAFVTSNA